MKLVINADDFGKNENATNAIAEAFQKGFVSQTTLMVNMPFADKAVALARERGFAGRVGLHLCLTEGRPLSSAMASCPAFCLEAGVFRGGVLPSVVDAESTAALKAEIRAQCERYMSFGLPLLHCDGHHHVQNRWVIARVLMPLLREFGFRTLRRPYNAYPDPCRPHIRPRLRQLRFALSARRHSLLASSDVFDGWTPTIERIVSRGTRTVEVMVHPGFDAAGTLVDVVDFENGSGTPLDGILSLWNAAGGR